MKTRLILLIAMLAVYGHSHAWIAYGFKSGMSRFDVQRYLAEKDSLVISENARETIAGPGDHNSKYRLVYCSTPQKLYLMKYRLDESRSAFVQAREKYEKRYGKPEGLDHASGSRGAENWATTDVSLMWVINESETILLTHDEQGTIAEFQDVSIC